eukprot:6492280-Amphidinium_carterae.4
MQTKRVVEKAAPPPPEHADDLVKMRMQCSRDFDFVSVSEVEAKADLRTLGNTTDLPWVEVADERGVKTKGLLLHRPGPLRVTLSYVEEIVASRTLLATGASVRDGQAREAGAQHMNKRCPATSTIITPEALEEQLENIRVSRAAAAMEAAANPQPPPLAMLNPATAAAAAADAATEEDAVELDPDLQRALDENKSADTDEAVQQGRGKGRAGKGKGKGRGKKRTSSITNDTVSDATQKRRRDSGSSAASVVHARSRSPARSSRATQNAGGACGSPSTKDIEQARKWFTMLSVGKALSGQKVKNDIYQAERAQKAVEGTPEDVLLNTKLTAVKAAAQLYPEAIGKMSTQLREAKLKDVFDDSALVDEVPASFKQALLVCRARDLRPAAVEEVTAWVQQVKIVPAGAVSSEAPDVMKGTSVRT